MSSSPTPSNAVPEFVVDRFADHSPETLRSIVAYADGRAMSSDVPQYVTEAFAMQDVETVREIAAYAQARADYLERLEDEPDPEPEVDEAEGDGTADESDGGQGPIVSGPFFG